VSASDRDAGLRCQSYYPHAIGHWLGLDVHDTPTIGSGTPLAPGMVVTVEPGLYFGHGDERVPEWCRGIGIRIEDDVLVRAAGEAPEVLTAGSPKHPDAIEELIRSRGAQPPTS
jgi:Xaa-Pro aminopeptidase